MGSEFLLYGYGLVCLSMIFFNLLYSVVMKGNERRLERRGEQFRHAIEAQLARIESGSPLDREHLSELERKLSRVNNLVVFDRVLTAGQGASADETNRQYQLQIQAIFLPLAKVYVERESMQAAYFAHFASRHRLRGELPSDPVQDIMIEYMKKDSLYCRVNAMEALYAFGSAESVVTALITQDREGAFVNTKILTDGLLSFTGDHELLTDLLWAQFKRFTLKIQLAILNYIRFRSGDYCEDMLELMLNPNLHKELRLAAIRYFARYPYQPAEESLIAFVSDKEELNWEYAAVSATALAKYASDEAVAALMSAMHSSNWYIRHNAALSLEAQGLSYSDLIEIVNGKDRYAREMIMYRLEARYLRTKEAEAQL